MLNFEQIRSAITTRDYKITARDPYMVCVELSLDQGRRHQSVFLAGSRTTTRASTCASAPSWRR
jgi:hypothetical protein